MRDQLKEQKGSILILFLVLLPFLLGISAVAVDMSVIYLEKIRLQNTVDAAALAGAEDLPISETKAIASAKNCAEENGFIFFSSITDRWVAKGNESQKIFQVQAQKSLASIFGRVMGLSQYDIHAQAVAKAAPLKSAKVLLPLGIIKGNWEYNQLYTLVPYDKKEGAVNGPSLTYVPLQVNRFKQQEVALNIGDKLAVQKNLEEGALTRIIREQQKSGQEDSLFLLPVLADIPGTDGKVEVIGFTWLLPEKFRLQGKDALFYGQLHKKAVAGPVVKENAGFFGAYGVALLQ